MTPRATRSAKPGRIEALVGAAALVVAMATAYTSWSDLPVRGVGSSGS